MGWSTFFQNIVCGDSSSISAACSLVGLVFTAIGITMVIITFRSQSKINSAQLELNRLLMDKERRDIMPIFTILSGSHTQDKTIGAHRFSLILRNAVATDIIFTTYSRRSSVPGVQKFAILTVDETIATGMRNKHSQTELVRLADLDFADDYGRRYVQDVTLDRLDNVSVTYPKLKF